MKEALVFAGAVIAGVAVGFSPGGESEEATSFAVPNLSGNVASGPVSAAEPLKLAPFAGSVSELHRESDGHFYATVEINGRPTRFMVDTGASAIALTNADAQALGLFWTYDELAVVAHGASGPVRGVYKTLDRVALGGHEVRGLNAIIVPEGLGISLLGQNFLSTIDPVRIEGDRMILGR